MPLDRDWAATDTDEVCRSCFALRFDSNVARKCVVAGRVNWSHIASRDRMRREGVEDKGATSVASTYLTTLPSVIHSALSLTQ